MEHVSYMNYILTFYDRFHETKTADGACSYHRDIDVCSDLSHETKTIEGACFIP